MVCRRLCSSTEAAHIPIKLCGCDIQSNLDAMSQAAATASLNDGLPTSKGTHERPHVCTAGFLHSARATHPQPTPLRAPRAGPPCRARTARQSSCAPSGSERPTPPRRTAPARALPPWDLKPAGPSAPWSASWPAGALGAAHRPPADPAARPRPQRPLSPQPAAPAPRPLPSRPMPTFSARTRHER